jgi:hypothetical protein
VQVLAQSAKVLVDIDIPTQLEAATGSLVAVILAAIRSKVTPLVGSPESLTYKNLVGAVEHLLVVADHTLIDGYSQYLSPVFGRWGESDLIEENINQIVQGNPVDVAVESLKQELDYPSSHAHDLVIHIPENFSNPLPPALQAVGIASEGLDRVGAWAGTQDNWCLVLWNKPYLSVVFKGHTVSWGLYRLNDLITPRVCAHDREIDLRYRLRRSIGPDDPLPAEIKMSLDALGVSSPEPPRCG